MSHTDPNLDALRKCYDDLLKPLTYLAYAYLHRYTQDKDVFKDIVHKSFVDLFKKGTDFTTPKIKAKLFKAVKNDCIDYIRCEKPRRKSWLDWLADQASRGDSEDDDFHKTERLDLIRREIDSLPPRTRACMLEYLDGKTPAEIAEKFGISERTYHNHKSQGIKILIKRLRNLSIWIIYAVIYFLVIYRWKK